MITALALEQQTQGPQEKRRRRHYHQGHHALHQYQARNPSSEYQEKTPQDQKMAQPDIVKRTAQPGLCRTIWSIRRFVEKVVLIPVSFSVKSDKQKEQNW